MANPSLRPARARAAAAPALNAPRALLALAAPLALAAALLLAPASSRAQTYFSTVAGANAIGLTVTNHGVLGNNFVSRDASLEYPLGTGFEHLVLGGLWIGAQATDAAGVFTGVTSGAIDVAQGQAGVWVTEFTPKGPIVLLSADPASPHYSPLARSDLDLVATYDDLTPKRVLGNPEDHRPLGVSVRQVVHQWNANGLEPMAFVRFVVRNVGASPLTAVRVGLYTLLASGSKNAYSCWPPSSGCGPGSWYGKAWLAWDAPERLLREHYCAGQPVPAGCNLAAVPHWIGVRLLTPPAAGQSVTVAGVGWGPGAPSRDTDAERYALMGTGTVADFASPDLAPGTGDPVELLALGPFDAIAPGDSIEVAFALIGAPDDAALRARSDLAQQVRDLGWVDPATPALAALLSAEAAPGRVALVWAGCAPGAAATVERAASGGAWRDLAGLTADAAGRVVFEDRAVEPGGSYDYRLRFADGARTAAERIVVPRAPAFGIAAPSPNPVAGEDPLVAFSLEAAGQAGIEVFDLSGRRVLALAPRAFEPGRHALRLAGAARLAPGVYVVRIAHGERAAAARMTVVR